MQLNSIGRWIIEVGRAAESVLGDKLLNINAGGAVRPTQKLGRNRDSNCFETCSHLGICKAIFLSRPEPTDVAYVYGAGKGRTVCHFAQYRLQKVVGIEIIPEFCEIARANARRLRNARAPIEIRNEDAAAADVSDGTIYFLFNPFGPQTLRDVLRNIEKSQSVKQEVVRIVYMNALHPSVFQEFHWLGIKRDYRRFFNDMRVVIYGNNVH
jgi:hypothetical protein